MKRMRPALRGSILIGLLSSASLTAVAGEARAANVIFSTVRDLARGESLAGRPVVQAAGTVQVRLGNGSTASFVDAAEFTIADDMTIELRRGTVTVSTPDGARTVVLMPAGVEGAIEGAGSSASFTALADSGRGHVMSGSAALAGGGESRRFEAGQFWQAGAQGVERVIAIGEQAVPGTDAAALAGGPAAVAAVGIPVALGEALAAAGASGDVVAAARRVEASVANPSLVAFPSDDYSTLVDYAARLSGAYGGPAFPGAGADIVRSYLEYVAAGGAREQFLAVYAGLLVQYLDLIRSGAAPSGFSGSSLDQINGFIAFQSRTSGFAALSAQNRTLVEAYLAFLSNGGDPDRFAVTYTDLIGAYFLFLRAGGDPLDFAQASQQTVNDYLAFLRDSGLAGQLSAANQALLDLYLESLAANGSGLAFADQYRSALAAYHAFLSGGRLPSEYSAISAEVLRQYLEALERTGLLASVLGDEAAFFQAYLAFLQAGGAIDSYPALPANIFTGYAGELSAFSTYLAGGNLPSEYSAAELATLRDYLEALAAAGALDRFLGVNADFFEAYLAFLRGGGAVDAFAGLPANIFAGYSTALSAYFDYLTNGGVPSAYGALTQAQIRTYLEALSDAGAFERYLGDLGTFYGAYLDYVAGGGNPDLYAGLPTPPDLAAFAAAVQAYAAFLRAGGLPSAYGDLDLATLLQYVTALVDAGLLDDRLGADSDLVEAYFAFLAGGGDPNGFADLPVYLDYAAALQAYHAFLAGGGLPSTYADATQAELLAYFEALEDAGILADRLTPAQLAFLTAFVDHVVGGGDPDRYAGLPGNPGGPGEPGLPGAFPNNAGRVFAANAGVSYQASDPPQVDDEGALVSAGDLARGSTDVADVAGDEAVIVGRFVNGDATFRGGQVAVGPNGGVPYAATAPITGDFPTSGTIDYEVYAATRPVFSSGGAAPGTFDADLTIGFGSTLSYGLDGTIVMPEAGGDATYRFASEGRAAGELVDVFASPQNAFTMVGAMTGIGGACLDNDCVILFFGGFAGDDPSQRAGFVYQTVDPNNFQTAERIQGAVAFRPVAGGGDPGGPTASTAAAAAWERWQDPTVPGAGAPGLPPLGPSPSADPGEMRQQANRLFGGQITFESDPLNRR